jgi:multiple sugar transport system permease protein
VSAATLPPVTASATGVRVSRLETLRRENRGGWLFATPFTILYVLFIVGPMLIAFVISLFNTTTVESGIGAWVGFGNYSEVVNDPAFWASMWHSVLFTVLTTPFLVAIPLCFAILASRLKRGKAFYRIAFFAPYVVPASAVVLVFTWLYQPQIGLISKLFGWVGLPEPGFLSTTSGGWLAVVVLTIWWTLGFNFILYTAAIQDIPAEIYEAASIDQATPWQQIRHVTLPMLNSTTMLVLLLQILASLKVFDQIYLLLSGGPNDSIRPAIEYIYDTGFTNYRAGYAAAASTIYFLCLVAFSASWFLIRRWRGNKAANA